MNDWRWYVGLAFLVTTMIAIYGVLLANILWR